MVEIAVEINTTRDTVFIPPAVPTGDPPILIKSNEMIDVAWVKFS